MLFTFYFLRTIGLRTLWMRWISIRLHINMDYDYDRLRPIQCHRKRYRCETNDQERSSSAHPWYLGVLAWLDSCSILRLEQVKMFSLLVPIYLEKNSVQIGW